MSAEPNAGAFAGAQPLTYHPGRRAGDAAVREHLPLVRRLAWHVHGSMSTLVDVEDLVQVGLVALVEAVAGWEARGEASLRPYLATRVRGAMIDELRRQAAATRGAMRRRRRYNEAAARLAQQAGRAPEEAAIAQALNVTVAKLRADYAGPALRFEPIDEVYADDQPWFADEAPDAFAALADAQQRDALAAAIADLPEREAQVIQLYYVEELNLEEIGEVFGIGAARVCQIKASAHARLRRALAR